MSQSRPTFAESLERTLTRLSERQRTVLAVGGTLAGMVGIGPGCDPSTPPSESGDVAKRTEQVLAYGQKDWAQNLGSRDRSKVRYYHEFWRDYSDCGSRFGCASITMFIKVAVLPTTGADLGRKKIGVVYREVGQDNPITSVGSYFGTHPDGMEEWHVPVKSYSHQGVFTFDAWYEDGTFGADGQVRRYYDDNNGQLYALGWTDPSTDYVTIRPDFGSTTAKIGASGLSGKLFLVLEDLDYAKDLSIQWSTDNWATTQSFGMGAVGDKNRLYWDSNIGHDYDRWVIDLDVPGTFTAFRYRVIYKHGGVAGSDVDTFVGGGASGFSINKP